jgi:hypothetical protein
LSGTTDGTVNVTGGATMSNLTVSKASGGKAYLASDATVSNNLTISSGNLTVQSDKQLTVTGTLTSNVTSKLTLESGASLKQTSASVSATVKRDVNAWGTGVLHGWHFLSSPVSAQSISTNFTVDPAANYDFFKWDETTNMWLNQKVGANNITSFAPGTGYLVAYAASSTKQFEGTLNKDNIPFSNLTISSGTNKGWHLLGNPYPCSLTWATGWSLTNIVSTAKIWHESNASYSDITSGGIIPALNGFMVQVAAGFGGSNSLTIPASAMTHSSTAWYKSSDNPAIKLVVNDPAGQTAQEHIIRFDAQSTIGFDPEFDSHFLKGYAPQLYSIAGEDELSTNTLPELNSQTQIPLKFIKNDGNNFTLEAVKIENIPGSVILNDLKTGAEQDLTVNPVYSFSSISSDNPSRFVISFSHLGIGGNDASNYFSIFTYDNQVLIKSSQWVSDGTIDVFNLMGQKLFSTSLSGNSVIFPLSAPTGYYLVKVVTPEATQTAKVFVK